jgi:hypothetical protein
MEGASDCDYISEGWGPGSMSTSVLVPSCCAKCLDATNPFPSKERLYKGWAGFEQPFYRPSTPYVDKSCDRRFLFAPHHNNVFHYRLVQHKAQSKCERLQLDISTTMACGGPSCSVPNSRWFVVLSEGSKNGSNLLYIYTWTVINCLCDFG